MQNIWDYKYINKNCFCSLGGILSNIYVTAYSHINVHLYTSCSELDILLVEPVLCTLIIPFRQQPDFDLDFIENIGLSQLPFSEQLYYTTISAHFFWIDLFHYLDTFVFTVLVHTLLLMGDDDYIFWVLDFTEGSFYSEWFKIRQKCWCSSLLFSQLVLWWHIYQSFCIPLHAGYGLCNAIQI